MLKNHISKLALAAIATMFFACQSGTTHKTQVPLFLGTYTSDGSEGIYSALFDTATGQLSDLQLAAKVGNPSYMAINREDNLLVAVSENDGSKANVFSYRINPKTRALSLIDSASTGGYASCYVSLIGENRVAIANYVSGDVSFIPFNNKGHFGTPVTTFKHSGTGPVSDRQEAPHAHSIMPDPNGAFIYSADLGADKVMVYEVADNEVRTAGTIMITPGAGPRHMAFSPCGQQMALLNELNHTVVTFSRDEHGAFTNQTSTVALLTDTLHAEIKSADIHYSPDGHFLYASVRGIDKIEVMDVKDKDRAPVRISLMEEGIKYPRNFSHDPYGKFLLVANKNNHNITVYSRNVNTGELSALQQALDLKSPVCIKFY